MPPASIINRMALRNKVAVCAAVACLAAADPAARTPDFQAPPGFVVEKVAGPPLIKYPLFACFDDRGRLFVAEGTGTNLPGPELLKRKLGRILVLEDTDGDGRFDTSKVFADDLTFPTGVLWHDGALYATSHPSLYRFEETPGGAIRREELVTGFKFNGNGCDIHGPFLGPDGRLYWTDGRHGYRVKTRDGQTLEGLASRVWRCRPDGTDVERLCGGGFDNPVQIAFTADGEALGTMDQGPGDALLHYVEGGVYPMEHPCLTEFVRTGPLLGSVRQYTAALPVALCGLTRYRSAAFGRDYQDSLFSTHYLLHRVVRHTLSRDGSTFRCEDRDFVTSKGHDVRLTDVLEDADGSLLFVDMGGWFTYGFPGNPVPRPEVLGAIYRVRRTGAPPVADPWGKSLKLVGRDAAGLVPLLDDPRPRVRDQVIARLGGLGADAVPALAGVLRPGAGRSAEARRSAVWALCRIDAPAARPVLRRALADDESGVRLAAAHAVGLHRDADALGPLAALCLEDELPVRRKAAESLGRIGRPEAVPALLNGLRKGGDRFLEHTLIYALIRINDRRGTRPALADAAPHVRRAGLVALDQMADGRLTRDEVVSLLDTDDPDLQQAALAVIGKQPGWSDAVHGLLRRWLEDAHPSAAQARSLAGALLAFSGEPAVQRLVADALAEPRTPAATRLLLLEVMARCRVDPPPAWLDRLGDALGSADADVRRAAVATVKARNVSRFDGRLLEMSRQKTLPAELRVAALECIVERRKKVDAESFTLLTAHLDETTEPLLRLAAARTLGAGTLTREQLLRLAEPMAQASTIVLRLLLPAFERSGDAGVGAALAGALRRSPGAEALTVGELDKALRGYPAEVRDRLRPLRDKLAARRTGQAAYLAALTNELLPLRGDAEAGRQVFFSRKVGCYGCHRAAGQGGQVGPDLSRVGRIRSPAEMLESIAYPSLTIVPEYRTFQVQTKGGRVVTGLVVRDSAEAVYLRTAELAEVRIPRKDVDELTPSDVSLMPEGLEKSMTRQELRDLLEFLSRQQ